MVTLRPRNNGGRAVTNLRNTDSSTNSNTANLQALPTQSPRRASSGQNTTRKAPKKAATPKGASTRKKKKKKNTGGDDDDSDEDEDEGEDEGTSSANPPAKPPPNPPAHNPANAPTVPSSTNPPPGQQVNPQTNAPAASSTNAQPSQTVNPPAPSSIAPQSDQLANPQQGTSGTVQPGQPANPPATSSTIPLPTQSVTAQTGTVTNTQPPSTHTGVPINTASQPRVDLQRPLPHRPGSAPVSTDPIVANPPSNNNNALPLLNIHGPAPLSIQSTNTQPTQRPPIPPNPFTAPRQSHTGGSASRTSRQGDPTGRGADRSGVGNMPTRLGSNRDNQISNTGRRQRSPLPRGFRGDPFSPSAIRQARAANNQAAPSFPAQTSGAPANPFNPPLAGVPAGTGNDPLVANQGDTAFERAPRSIPLPPPRRRSAERGMNQRANMRRQDDRSGPGSTGNTRRRSRCFFSCLTLGALILYFLLSVLTVLVIQEAPPGMWRGIDILVKAQSAPEEPLGIFNDYSAMLRAWARVGALRSPGSRGLDISNGQIRLKDIFNRLALVGDTCNRDTGEFFNATIHEPRNPVLVDLPTLRGSIAKNIRVAKSALATAHPPSDREFFASVVDRILKVRDLAYSEFKIDDKQVAIDYYTGTVGGDIADRARIAPVRVSPLGLLRGLADIDMFDERANQVYATQESRDKATLESSLDALFKDLETLQAVISLASARGLVDAQKHKSWVHFPLFKYVTAEWSSQSPMKKAMQNALSTLDIAEERKMIDQMKQDVHWLVQAVGQISRCETELQRNIAMLLNATEYPGQTTDSPYIYLPEEEKWLTGWPKGAPAETKELSSARKWGLPLPPRPRMLPACAPLHQAPYFSEVAAEIKPLKSSDIDYVVSYVPSMLYVHDLFGEDVLWVEEMEKKAILARFRHKEY